MNRPINEEERAALFVSGTALSRFVLGVEACRATAAQALAETDILSEEARHIAEFIRVCEGLYVRIIDGAVEKAQEEADQLNEEANAEPESAE